MDVIPKWGKRQERENEREIEACCFWPQKVVERGRRGDRGKRAVHTDGAAGLASEASYTDQKNLCVRFFIRFSEKV